MVYNVERESDRVYAVSNSIRENSWVLPNNLRYNVYEGIIMLISAISLHENSIFVDLDFSFRVN